MRGPGLAQNRVAGIRDIGAHINGRSIVDGAITYGSNVLSPQAHKLQQRDESKLIAARFAGAMGVPLVTRVDRYSRNIIDLNDPLSG